MFARKMHTLLPTLKERTFVALDFETADYGADSACAIGIVRVENLRIVAKQAILSQLNRASIHNLPQRFVYFEELRHTAVLQR